MKGLTSIELAILLAIIIVIAVAVGWYMYTTFVASTTSQAKLSISQATYSSTSKNLTLIVTNPGPAATVTITAVYLNGTQCTGTPVTVSTSQGATAEKFSCTITAVPGTTLNGYVVLSTGTTFPFVATVT
jgi:uncharacterized protein (UPF0333 family)